MNRNEMNFLILCQCLFDSDGQYPHNAQYMDRAYTQEKSNKDIKQSYLFRPRQNHIDTTMKYLTK